VKPLGECRLLLVDDARSNLDILVAGLGADYKLSLALTGEAALQVAARTPPDLVLLDIQMPGLDGFDVCRRLREMPGTSGVPVIFLSSLDDARDKARGFEAGGNDYVTKPFELLEVRARVQSHLKAKAYNDAVKDEMEALRQQAELDRHRTLSQMVAGVAHELNTPLGIANTAADMIVKRIASPAVRARLDADDTTRLIGEDIREAAGLLARNLTRAHRLVEQFKKVSVGQLTDEPSTVVLQQVIDDTVAMYAISARDARLRIAGRNTLPDPAREWTGCAGHLTQILLNFLTNCARYAYAAGEGGPVEIVLAEDRTKRPEQFVLTVRDHGRGMSEQDRARVFEPFFTTGRGAGGSGLGMAIVHNLVTASLHGRVEVESALGSGSAFHVVFPQVIGG
jgi:signal transduction histidine kinase